MGNKREMFSASGKTQKNDGKDKNAPGRRTRACVQPAFWSAICCVRMATLKKY